MRSYTLRIAGILIVTCVNSGRVSGVDSVSYEREIKPILKARCYACHGGLKQEGELRVDTGRQIRQGGESGPAVVRGQPGASLVIQRVTSADIAVRMPPEGEPLSSAQIDVLSRWISQGADSPDEEQPEADPRQHWAFRPPVRPAWPVDLSAAAGRNPIDSFLDADLAKHHLKARPSAPAHVLLRRVYLDLIGLPPTGEQLQAFLADESPDAYERIVDRLLVDPRCGERWGRHWMDIWRYSDWYGRRDVNDVRNSASQLFRWRDWIVTSLNEDKGYDRMIQEMLAADEICPEDYEAGVATGYLIRNYYSLNANDWMRNAVEHTGKAFLGLTFNCAHCHDHKYDPILQDDYFRLRAFFEPVFIRQDRVPGEADPGIFQDYSYGGTRSVQRLGAVRVFDKSPAAPTWFYTGGDERNRVTDRGSIPPGVPAFLENSSLRIEPVELPPRAWYPGLRSEIQQTLQSDAHAAVRRAESNLAAARRNVDVPPEVQRQLTRAEADYAAAVRESNQSPESLAESQFLLLDAGAGRCIVQNGLKQLTSFRDGDTLRFQLRIVQDAHVNFQFAKDNVQGLTAGFLCFEKGQIRAYCFGVPGESPVGTYDFSNGQNSFDISISMQPSTDQALLTITAEADRVVLVDGAALALNGWSPLHDPVKSISFDARTGSVAAVDEIVWQSMTTSHAAEAETGATRVVFDFESPRYTEGEDIIGIDGWASSSWRVEPARSVVATRIEAMAVREAAKNLAAARRAVESSMLQVTAAAAELAAAQADAASLEARITADRVKFGEISAADAVDPTQHAGALERQAVLSRAEADVLAKQYQLAIAENKPASDGNRAQEIEAATKSLTAARAGLEKAQTIAAEKSADQSYTPLSPQFPQTSTGRRRALAEWITSHENPLTARVAVNHIWSRHFHSPLVASVYDFGRNGARPVNQNLLDWLAVEFMESGWSMKHLHRLIVTSRAYQRDSKNWSVAASESEPGSGRESAAAPSPAHTGETVRADIVDPENTLLWRMNAARMESEVLRDSLLFVADRLDQTMGGVELENDKALTTNRRSLYYSVYPEAGGKSALGELFDAPDPLDCYRRTSSIVPQQALALTNSELIHEVSEDCVRNWQASQSSKAAPTSESDTRFVVDMFLRILSRYPTDEELQICRDVLAQQQQLSSFSDTRQAATAARESLVRVLLNHNDFITVR